MKLLLTVQGEGRGHMTQALAFQQWSRRSGHEVVGVLAGANRSRSWPDFFENGFEVPVRRLASPGFVFSRGRAVNLPATLWQLLRHGGEFRQGLEYLDRVIEETRPDLLVNFLEPLVGLHARWKPGRVSVLAVGHQFMLGHSRAVKCGRHPWQQWGLRRYVEATGFGATRYALSFHRAEDEEESACLVGPPLLRDELFALPAVPGDYLLVYLLNDGYRREVEQWHRDHPDIPLHCFYDRPQAPVTEVVDPTLTFHTLHGERFLRMMAGCRGVACTAGFESVSEAAWFGKPVLAIPVEGHIEQLLNAIDAQDCGLAVAGERFDLDRLREACPRRAARNQYREWLAESDERLSRAVQLAAAANRAGRRRRPVAPVTSPARLFTD